MRCALLQVNAINKQRNYFSPSFRSIKAGCLPELNGSFSRLVAPQPGCCVAGVRPPPTCTPCAQCVSTTRCEPRANSLVEQQLDQQLDQRTTHCVSALHPQTRSPSAVPLSALRHRPVLLPDLLHQGLGRLPSPRVRRGGSFRRMLS